MSYFVYQFEAVFIQDYILSGGKIKTMVGASELLEAVTSDLLEKTINNLNLEIIAVSQLPDAGDLSLKASQVVLPRRTGGVFMMVSQNESLAKQFSELWPILVSNFAPGLRFSAALAYDENYAEAGKKVREQLNAQKNRPQTQLPEATPITQRFQKTGQAQIDSQADWTMLAKQTHPFNALAEKHFGRVVRDIRYIFPKQFEHKKHDAVYWQEAFPFKTTEPGNHDIAIIHTDGNGLGGYLQKIFNSLNQLTAADNIRAYAQFSSGLDEATQQAAQQATHWLIEQYAHEDNPYKQKAIEQSKGKTVPLPMRPLILGGDDLTCLVRADYALGFIQAFTRAFESATQKFVEALPQSLSGHLPEKLTCTTGMLFLKSNQPFRLGYQLVEELCSSAKKEGQVIAKAANSIMPPSLINFMHTTNTLFDELDVQIAQELITPTGQKLTAAPYAFADGQGRLTLQDLFAIKACFDATNESKLKPSALRNYAGHLHQNPHYAEAFWNRWEKHSKEGKMASAWEDFKQRWSKNGVQELPLSDLITLFALDIHPHVLEEAQ